MRHRKSGRKLGRDSAHRKAMLRNLTTSLFEHEIIKTTLPKAKELRRHAEPLITLAKTDCVANRRLAFARIGSKATVGKLFAELGPRYQARPGGYTRILKCGQRRGDAAPMAYMELVDRPLTGGEEELAEAVEETAALPSPAASQAEPAAAAETSDQADPPPHSRESGNPAPEPAPEAGAGEQAEASEQAEAEAAPEAEAGEQAEAREQAEAEADPPHSRASGNPDPESTEKTNSTTENKGKD